MASATLCYQTGVAYSKKLLASPLMSKYAWIRQQSSEDCAAASLANS
jgi:hypothetical protein